MNLSDMLFDGWQDIVRTLAMGAMAYVMLIVFLRISGKRTLAKLNAFDLVVTIALGSVLSSIILNESVSLSEGATALAVLIALQWVVTSISVRSESFARLVRSEPTLLARDGVFCRDAMRRERITESEALSSIRENGGTGVEAVAYLVLESDGSLSATLRDDATPPDAPPRPFPPVRRSASR